MFGIALIFIASFIAFLLEIYIADDEFMLQNGFIASVSGVIVSTPARLFNGGIIDLVHFLKYFKLSIGITFVSFLLIFLFSHKGKRILSILTSFLGFVFGHSLVTGIISGLLAGGFVLTFSIIISVILSLIIYFVFRNKSFYTFFDHLINVSDD